MYAPFYHIRPTLTHSWPRLIALESGHFLDQKLPLAVF